MVFLGMSTFLGGAYPALLFCLGHHAYISASINHAAGGNAVPQLSRFEKGEAGRRKMTHTPATVRWIGSISGVWVFRCFASAGWLGSDPARCSNDHGDYLGD